MSNNNSDLNLSQASVSVSTIVPLTPDLSQADIHLEMLGLQPEECRLRFIHPQTRKCKPSPYSHNAILKYQSQGYNAYLVVNVGGDSDKDIKECTATFYEHDDLSPELQLELWRTLGLPVPSFQVSTGGKSVHTYYVFDKRLDPSTWLPLQWDLICHADSDKTCKNLSRVMRLAGSVYYKKPTGEPLGLATIESCSGARYSYEEMLGAIQSHTPAIAPQSPSPSPAQDTPPSPSPSPANGLWRGNYNQLVAEEIKQRVDIGSFNLFDHDFQESGGSWRGKCPWHDSVSGTAFHVDRGKGTMLWHCPSCEVGGDIFNYHYMIRNGNGDMPPDKFPEILEEVATRFNLSVSRSKQGKQGKQGASPDKQQAPTGDAKGKIDDLDEIISPFCIKYPHLKYVKKYKSFYYYQGKFWEKKEDSEVENRVRQFIRQHNYKLTKSSSIADIVKVLKWDLSNSDIDDSSQYLGFEDGVLDLSDFRFHAHNSSFGNTFILPRKYLCASSENPAIDRFLAELTNSNPTQIRVIMAFMAACLKRINKCQKFLHLLGSAGSGKGTFLRLLGELVGSTNSHSSSLAILENSQFESFNLIDKLLTVFPDEHKISGNLSRFLSLTGGDSIRCEEKYRESFSAPYRGMVAIASNFEVFVSDAMDAVARRRILISCDFKPTKVDPYLDERLKAELPALTKKLVAMSEDEIVSTLMLKHINQEGNWQSRIANNGVAAWMNECVVFDPDSRVLVGRNKDECLTGDAVPCTLYGSYGAFCRGAGYQVRSLNNFSQDVIATARTFWDCQVFKRVSNKGTFLEGVRLASPGGGLSGASHTENAESQSKSQWWSPEVVANFNPSGDLNPLHSKESGNRGNLNQKLDSNLKNDVARKTHSPSPSPSPSGDAINQSDTQSTGNLKNPQNQNETEFSGKVTTLPLSLSCKVWVTPGGDHQGLPLPKKEEYSPSPLPARGLWDCDHLSGIKPGDLVLNYKLEAIGIVSKFVLDDDSTCKMFAVTDDDGRELPWYPGECEIIPEKLA